MKRVRQCFWSNTRSKAVSRLPGNNGWISFFCRTKEAEWTVVKRGCLTHVRGALFSIFAIVALAVIGGRMQPCSSANEIGERQYPRLSAARPAFIGAYNCRRERLCVSNDTDNNWKILLIVLYKFAQEDAQENLFPRYAYALREHFVTRNFDASKVFMLYI